MPCAVKQKVWTNTMGQLVLKPTSLGHLTNGLTWAQICAANPQTVYSGIRCSASLITWTVSAPKSRSGMLGAYRRKLELPLDLTAFVASTRKCPGSGGWRVKATAGLPFRRASSEY